MNSLSQKLRLTGLTIGIAVGLVGCGSRDDWFPMKVGKHWTYQVRAGFDRRVEPVKVLRPLAVASSAGFELTGPLGVSRLAWKKGILLAESTVSVQFIPPVPILVTGADLSKEKNKSKPVEYRVATWHGRVIVIGKERPGSAVLTERNEVIDFGSRKVPTILATLSLKVGLNEIVLKSWFQQGVGLIQQEQRTNGARVIQLQMLGHGD